jgi:hypothetical protein
MNQDLKARVEENLMPESELKLLPCPMCAETQIKLTEWPADATICEIFCLNCHLNTGAKFTKEEAIKHWNCRAKDPEKEALIDLLTKVLSAYKKLNSEISDSDLDDEQPKHIFLSLGDIRSMQKAIRRNKK